MNILSANLKHLYQRRIFWLLSLFAAFAAFGIVTAMAKGDARNHLGVFCVPAIWMIFAGTFLASLPLEILTKPFSYCLPGHQNIPRKFLFWTGLPLSFLWSLGFFLFPDLNFVQTLPACLSAFATFTMFYWLGVWLVFRFRAWSLVFGFLPLLVFGEKSLNMSVFMVDMLVTNPLPMILVGGWINVWAWRYWGRPDLARHYCGKLWLGAFDFWNKEKMEKLKLARLAETGRKKPDAIRISSGVENFFLSRVRRAESGSAWPYIWGGLYKSFGIMLSKEKQNWVWLLIIILPMLCYLCYTGPGGHMIFFMPGIMVVSMNLHVQSSLLLSGGRRERFWSALTLAVVTTILITVFVTFLAALTTLFEPILPVFTIKNHTFVFHALNIKLFFVPVLMIPVTLATGLIFRQKPTLQILFIILFFGLLGGSAGFLRHHLSVIYPVVPVIIPILLGATWAVFIAVLRYICRRCCLVNQSRY